MSPPAEPSGQPSAQPPEYGWDTWPGAADGAGTDPDAFDAALRASVARAVADRPATVDADPWRQAFHVQPPVGLLNDPNGVVQHEGVYHLCYQWHPGAPKHGLKLWAYLTSTDLVHWTDHGVALTPSHPYDSHGCYSGSGIIHDGAVHFLYTGNVRTPDGGRTPLQVLARVQPDGTVTKHPDNPVVGVIPGYSGHVRDPKVWHEDGQYWMLLGAQTEDLHGTALLLRSPDLLDWTLLGQLGGGADDPVGGYMWECPDLLRFPEADVLVISAQYDLGEGAQPYPRVDRTEYALGRLTLDPVGFARSTDLQAMDHGPDFYAPQTFHAEDGRRILIGWLGMPDQDGQPLLPDKHPSVANGWVHCLTVPRTIRLEGTTLVQQPVDELALLRGEPVTASGLAIDAATSSSVAGIRGTSLDLALTVTCGPDARLVLRLREGAAGRPVRLVIDPGAGSATLDRTLLGTGEGGAFSGAFPASGSVDVRVLLDHSSVEVFVAGGRLVLSARIYPVDGDDVVCFDAEGGDVVLDVTAWPMQSP